MGNPKKHKKLANFTKFTFFSRPKSFITSKKGKDKDKFL